MFEFDSPEMLAKVLEKHGYLADEGLATACFLALRMGRPLFLEGEAGVGKTELAKTIATVLGAGSVIQVVMCLGVLAVPAVRRLTPPPRTPAGEHAGNAR